MELRSSGRCKACVGERRPLAAIQGDCMAEKWSESERGETWRGVREKEKRRGRKREKERERRRGTRRSDCRWWGSRKRRMVGWRGQRTKGRQAHLVHIRCRGDTTQVVRRKARPVRARERVHMHRQCERESGGLEWSGSGAGVVFSVLCLVGPRRQGFLPVVFEVVLGWCLDHTGMAAARSFSLSERVVCT